MKKSAKPNLQVLPKGWGNKNEHRRRDTITIRRLQDKRAEDEPEINTAAPDELPSSRWETHLEGLEESACHAQPAQTRETGTKNKAGHQKQKQIQTPHLNTE